MLAWPFPGAGLGWGGTQARDRREETTLPASPSCVHTERPHTCVAAADWPAPPGAPGTGMALAMALTARSVTGRPPWFRAAWGLRTPRESLNLIVLNHLFSSCPETADLPYHPPISDVQFVDF